MNGSRGGVRSDRRAGLTGRGGMLLLEPADERTLARARGSEHVRHEFFLRTEEVEQEPRAAADTFTQGTQRELGDAVLVDVVDDSFQDFNPTVFVRSAWHTATVSVRHGLRPTRNAGLSSWTIPPVTKWPGSKCKSSSCRKPGHSFDV